MLWPQTHKLFVGLRICAPEVDAADSCIFAGSSLPLQEHAPMHDPRLAGVMWLSALLHLRRCTYLFELMRITTVDCQQFDCDV